MHSLHQLRKKSYLGPKHMTPQQKKKKVSGDQGDDLQYPIPGLDDDLLQQFSQERV